MVICAEWRASETCVPAVTGIDCRKRSDEQGYEKAWVRVRGADDLLRLHANLRAGRRPCAGLFQVRQVECSTFGAPVKMRKLRPDRSEVFSWAGEVLRCDDESIVLRAEFNVDQVELGFTTFRRGDIFVEFYYWQRWFNIFQISAPDGTLKGWYANLGQPVELEDGGDAVLCRSRTRRVGASRRDVRRARRGRVHGRPQRPSRVGGAGAARTRRTDCARRARRGPPLVVSWLVAFGCGAAVAGAAYWRRALTRDGAVAAAVMGGLVFGRARWRGAAALLAFFVSSSALSRFRERHQQSGLLGQAKGARRDAWQVLANGGAATLALVAGSEGGFVSGLAAAGADTWATEIGMLAGHSPRLITSWRPVEPGTSGGVTLPGLAASVGGAACVGLAWWFATRDGHNLRMAVLAGTLGSVADSLLGATVQALYRCAQCGSLTERGTHCDQPTMLVRGYAWINNDTVNAAATLLGALIGYRSRLAKT